MRYGGARVLLDHPRDPASPEGASETEFTRRFGERLEGENPSSNVAAKSNRASGVF